MPSVAPQLGAPATYTYIYIYTGRAAASRTVKR